MNVIVANRRKEVFSDLNVDILKSISGEYSADEIIQMFSNFFYNRMFLDITAIKDFQDIKVMQKLSIALDVSKIILLLNDNETVNSDAYKSQLVSMGIYNFTNDIVGVKYLYDNPNSYKDVAHYQTISEINHVKENEAMGNKVKVIGFKNVTEHAGATSLIYMLKKELATRYSVVALEVDKKNFMFFNDKDMISVFAQDLGNTILKYRNIDVILVDLNESDDSLLDGDVFYLLEPTTIKLNKLLFVNKSILSKISKKNVILNMSLLNDADIKDFEKESGCIVYYNLPPMSDKVNNSEILLPFLEKVGLVKKVESNDNKSGNKLFGFLKF